MKKFQEFLGYWLTVTLVLVVLSIVVGLGLIGWLVASQCWYKLFGVVELDTVIFIVSMAATIIHVIAERKKK